jgi:dihydrofolate reductase
MSVHPRVTLIVARARNGVIGRDNTIPWHLPEDLKHFKASTMGHAVVMGRRTFDSIGRPLPGRRIVVLTRDPGWSHVGCERAGSIESAMRLLADQGEIFIAGGAEVYGLALAHATRMLITDVDLEPEGDTWFDEPDADRWQCLKSTYAVSSSGLGYTIRELVRRPEPASSATISLSPL